MFLKIKLTKFEKKIHVPSEAPALCTPSPHLADKTEDSCRLELLSGDLQGTQRHQLSPGNDDSNSRKRRVNGMEVEGKNKYTLNAASRHAF